MRFIPELVREQFPALSQKVKGKPVVFFDGPGGSQVPQSVLDAMVAYLGRYNANLGGHYFSSHKTVELVQSAREHVQALLNAPSPESIVFGPNMTSLTFQFSRAISRDWQLEDEVIVTALDHYSNVSSWQQAAQDKGVKVHQARVNPANGTLDEAHLLSLINSRTRLVAVTYASNTTGSLVELEAIIEAAHQVGAMVYVDAVHYLPHHLPDVQALGCDFLACSAYKFFGPHVGIVYVAPQWQSSITPYKVEPATNQGPGRFETGTLNFEGLAGVIAAVQYLAQWGDPQESLRERLVASYRQYQEHEQRLSEYFLHKLTDFPEWQLHGVHQADLRTPTFALTLREGASATIAKMLGEQNICVWNGHFYALGLIRQLGLEESGGVLRIGFMHYNTTAEIDELFRVLNDGYSPLN
ncbi:cysteine desulfurase-like protein [Vibrio sp. AH4]|uniref:cysteine desulfurase-like protein n=1 Tax=Vibrio sp. AH4 TaxID=2919577 RepID=UPI002739A076|nr:cysteine desulfurase-like protein [Vibrio sp. AH4]MDP4492628.1 cysteine desulfurase-like protein [Vibrio sp. AH4]